MPSFMFRDENRVDSAIPAWGNGSRGSEIDVENDSITELERFTIYTITNTTESSIEVGPTTATTLPNGYVYFTRVPAGQEYNFSTGDDALNLAIKGTGTADDTVILGKF